MRFKQTLNLSLELAKAEFKLRNEGSYLGIFWYLLNPLLLFGLLFLIFFDRLGQNIPDYPVYLLLGLIIFNFFQQTTIESTKTIQSHKGVIKSINFPKESLIGSIVLKFLFSHIFEIILLIIFLIIFKIPIQGIIFYPLILFFLSIFIFGACLILSSIAVYFVDLENIWAFVIRLIWLGTPIFYAIGGQTKLFYVNLFNPLYYFITITRDLIIYSKIPELKIVITAIFFSFLFLLVGLLIFNKLKIKFSEMV